MSAAKNEFEPFQIVVHADADATATLRDDGVHRAAGAIPRIEIRRVGYVHIAMPSGRLVDHERRRSRIRSSPPPSAPAESAPGGQNQPFWITVYVPPDAAAGDYTATLTVTVDGAAQDVPVEAPRLRLRPARPRSASTATGTRASRSWAARASLAAVQAAQGLLLRAPPRALERRLARRASITTAASPTTAPRGTVHRRQPTTTTSRSLGPEVHRRQGLERRRLPLVRDHAVRRQLDAAPADVLRRRPRPGSRTAPPRTTPRGRSCSPRSTPTWSPTSGRTRATTTCRTSRRTRPTTTSRPSSRT